MTTISKSQGAALERSAAAPLQAGGWFVIRGASDPSFRAFELDVLGYRLSGDGESAVVVESKSGNSGFGDFWKLLGLKTHLEIGRGVLLADETDPLHPIKRETGNQHEIAVIHQERSQLASAYKQIGLIEHVPTVALLEAWEFAYEVEDGLLRVLRDKALWDRYDTIRIAKQQVQYLATRAWIEPDPWQQAADLYDLYFQEKKIARAMAGELSSDRPSEVFKKAMYDGAHEEVQACFYLEHRKRIAVAFAATRCAALKPRSGMWAPSTPSAFKELVRQVGDREAWKLPNILQLYFLGFGGLSCLHLAEEEGEALAEQAGCSPDDVVDLIAIFDELFPYQEGGGSWFHEGNEMVRLKLMPAPLRGAGLRMREALFGFDWHDLATESQLEVCGTNHLGLASAITLR